MIEYYGTPLTPKSKFVEYLTNRNSLVSFANQQDVEIAFENCDKVILDNGAFTMWTKGKKVNWDDYYKWVELYSNREFYFIPDVIDGSEDENDALLEDNPFSDGVPIWHIAESFDRLERLIDKYDFIAIGSSGEYSTLGTPKWHSRMDNVMKIICDEDGIPNVKIHMLRCLNPKIFTKYPFYSGDSTNLARNHKRDGGWNIINRIEKYNSPTRYKFRKNYEQQEFYFK